MFNALLASAQTPISQVQRTVEEAHRSAAAVQQTIDAHYQQLNEGTRQYRELELQLRRIESANRKLTLQLTQGGETQRKLTAQLDAAADLEAGIEPLMQQMHTSLRDLVARDLPYQRAERLAVVDRLGDTLEQVDMPLSQRYRQLVLAFLQEAQHGQEFAHYSDEIDVAGERLTVDVFRLGRLGMYYLTPEGKQAGFYLAQSARWQPMDIALAPLRQAKKNIEQESAEQLLALPLPVLERGVKP